MDQAIAKLNSFLEPHRKEMDVLTEAMKEVAHEEGEKKKLQVKELWKKAKELETQYHQAKKEFNKNTKKWEKELGKIIANLQRFANNQPPLGEEDEGTDIEPAPTANG